MDFRRDCLGIGMPDIPGCPATSLYVSQYQTVYDAFASPPPASVAAAQNTMVTSLVNDGIWAKLDVFYVFANYWPADALINWINPGTFDATAVSSPGFISYEGYSGDGAADYINTNYNPATDAINYAQNNASSGVYVRTNVTENGIDYGSGDGTRSLLIYTRSAGNTVIARKNDNSNASTANTDSRGMFILSRSDAANYKIYKNKSNITSPNIASVGIPNNDIFVLAWDNSGSAGVYSTKQVSMFFAGSSFTQADVNSMTDNFEIYMDSNGKGVIT